MSKSEGDAGAQPCTTTLVGFPACDTGFSSITSGLACQYRYFNISVRIHSHITDCLTI